MASQGLVRSEAALAQRRDNPAPFPFADDVRRGLTAAVKTLPSKYFYDALGSALFEAICYLPEYYLTRAEGDIFTRHAGAIVGQVHGPIQLVELGSGSATKTRAIIRAILARQPQLRYQPIDISPSALEASAVALSQEYSNVAIDGIVGEYLEGMRQVSHTGNSRTLVLFLGSNIGNFDTPEAIALLRAVRETLRSRDALLLGVDLLKDRTTLERAYDDTLGVTAAFNLNLLNRINGELGGNFLMNSFAHRALFNEPAGRVEMHLVSKIRQSVAIEALNLTVGFDEGEHIHTESSYKYDADGIAHLAAAAGFEISHSWLDKNRLFSSNLFVVP